ncbi:hypothetical protein N7530_007088 [Penicillium desertorum]|uniref:Uncharacterized protein n=1 Tax=Penicillium desertorum TaxID=1303715 RepID=A0A9W9WTP7_9EURO|nr:hypothetical protein N7530_007088 [Penicillium desertorum]
MNHIAIDPDLYAPDSTYSPDDWQSETTSIRSSIYRGLMDNGRRSLDDIQHSLIVLYISIAFEERILTHLYSIPSDEQQFETYEAGYIFQP